MKKEIKLKDNNRAADYLKPTTEQIESELITYLLSSKLLMCPLLVKKLHYSNIHISY